MALSARCPRDITSVQHQSTRFSQGTNQAMSSSFLKYNYNIHRTLKSKTASLLFASLEYRFQKMPEGFYKFSSPCDNSYYRKGDSFSEELGISNVTLWRSMRKICTAYNSKSLYFQALEELGKVGAFQGKPYLSYHDKKTGQTFYFRNYKAVNRVLNGTYDIDIYITKCNLQEISKMKGTVDYKMKGTVPFKMKPLEPVEAPPTMELGVTSKKTLQRIPISLSLSNDNLPPNEQPKEEGSIEVDLVITEQPAVTISTINQMISSWKRIVALDCDQSPNKSTIDKLAKAYVEVFSSSLAKWEEFCLLVASSKYLMGETHQKFKLNLGWASKLDSIDKIINGHFTTGDKNNVIYYELDPISDPDPIVLKFKNACLHNLGKGRYISWIKPMRISFINNEIVCTSPTSFAAKHVGSNDPLGFQYFINDLPVGKIVFKEPDGKVVGEIVSRNSK